MKGSLMCFLLWIVLGSMNRWPSGIEHIPVSIPLYPMQHALAMSLKSKSKSPLLTSIFCLFLILFLFLHILLILFRRKFYSNDHCSKSIKITDSDLAFRLHRRGRHSLT
eukprot:163523_1